MSSPLLELSDVVVQFDLGRNRPPLSAVDGVSLTVATGDTLGIVGESGSGKTTLGRAILGLTPVESGTIRFDNRDITHLGHGERRRLSADLQVVFQDPYSSLNPTRTIEQTLAETLRVHKTLSQRQVSSRVQEMLDRVGLPSSAAKRYPLNFSGGQRQRIAIARALMRNPKLVICDEPVSALDLSVQAQILNLLRELQRELGLAYLFIAHDLDVVRHLSHRILVVYKGRIAEEGDAKAVYDSPIHPYTKALLAAAPVPDPDLQRQRRQQRVTVSGPPAGPEGCLFASRCPNAVEICRTQRPSLEATPRNTLVACHRWRELDLPANSQGDG